MAMQTRKRLPTLNEVLNRRTLPPVDLFSFYIYMRDQQRSVDYLDFWLDVAQHMSLCRLYVRELRRSVLIATPDLEKETDSKHSSQILEQLTADDMEGDHRLSAFLRHDDKMDEKYESREAMGSTPTSSGHAEDTNSPTQTVSRADIRASAERILYTYLIQGSEREITLPAHLIRGIVTSIEVDGRDDPEVFDEAKDYVFQAMERDAFPGFLRAKALGNIVPSSALLRLIIGLISLFAGFWTAFTLIFLDWQPQSVRLWVILPFGIAIYCLISHQYDLDPILALCGLSEATLMSFMRIREPYIRQLLMRRAIWELALTVLIVAALTVLFVLVPGRRL